MTANNQLRVRAKEDTSAYGLITWAVEEIRGLDELCRSMIPDYMPLDSNDIEKLKGLTKVAASLGLTKENTDMPEGSAALATRKAKGRK